MDWGFFESLTKAEAELFLKNFLRESGVGFERMVPDLSRNGVRSDFSLDSIALVYRWVLPKLKTSSKEPDKSLPEWLLQSESYTKYLFEFDDDSKVLILRAAYYLGESFSRASDGLSWSTGDRKAAHQNQPVVVGFENRMELPVLGVAEAIFNGLVAGTRSLEDMEQTIEKWRSWMPR